VVICFHFFGEEISVDYHPHPNPLPCLSAGRRQREKGNNLIIRNSFSIVFEKPGIRGLVLEVGENLNLHYSGR
jgi:proteasome lid subunit RPN8/RPN11